MEEAEALKASASFIGTGIYTHYFLKVRGYGLLSNAFLLTPSIPDRRIGIFQRSPLYVHLEQIGDFCAYPAML